LSRFGSGLDFGFGLVCAMMVVVEGVSFSVEKLLVVVLVTV
jgi:hypothetical protein